MSVAFHRVVWIVLSTCVLLSTTGCQKPVEPEFRELDNIQLKGAKRDGTLVITADARFFNPNGFGVEATGLQVELSIDGRQTATVQQTVSVSVPKNSEFSLPVEIEVPLNKVFDDLGALLDRLLSRKKREVHVLFDGRVLIEAVGVELVVPFRHEETHEIDM